MGRGRWILAFMVMALSGCGGVDWFPSTGPSSAATITVTASPSSPIVNSNVTITATVKKSDGTAVEDGTLVSFSIPTGTGTVTPSSASTTGGVATTTLTSTAASSCTVNASSGIASGKVVVTFQPILTVTASTSSISSTVGGQSIITATVKNLDGTNVSDGTTVTFGTTGGLLDVASATTSGGSAKATLTIFPNTFISGTIIIVTATSGTNSNTIPISIF